MGILKKGDIDLKTCIQTFFAFQQATEWREKKTLGQPRLSRECMIMIQAAVQVRSQWISARLFHSSENPFVSLSILNCNLIFFLKLCVCCFIANKLKS